MAQEEKEDEKEGDVYSDKREELVEDDEITPGEEGFMEGYEEDAEEEIKEESEEEEKKEEE